MDSLRDLFEMWFDRRGKIISLSPPLGATEQDMETMARVTEVMPAVFEDAATERIQTGTAEQTAWLTAVPWFERGAFE